MKTKQKKHIRWLLTIGVAPLILVLMFMASLAVKAATIKLNSMPLEFIAAIKNTNTATATMTAEAGQTICLGDRISGKLSISCQSGPGEVQLGKGDAAWKYKGTLDNPDRLIQIEGSAQHDLSLNQCDLLGAIEMNSFSDETHTRLLDTDGNLVATLTGSQISESAKIPAHEEYLVNARGLNAIIVAGGNDSAIVVYCLKTVGQNPNPPDPNEPENCFWVSLIGPFVKGQEMKWEVQNLCKFDTGVWDSYTSIKLTDFSDPRCSEMLSGRPIIGREDLQGFACPLPAIGEKKTYTAIPADCGELSWWAWHWVPEKGQIEPFEMFSVKVSCALYMPLTIKQ